METHIICNASLGRNMFARDSKKVMKILKELTIRTDADKSAKLREDIQRNIYYPI